MSKNSENPDFRRFFPCAARMLLEQTNTRPDLDVAQKLWLFHAFLGCLRSLLLSFSQSAKMSKMSFWAKSGFFSKIRQKIENLAPTIFSLLFKLAFDTLVV